MMKKIRKYLCCIIAILFMSISGNNIVYAQSDTSTDIPTESTADDEFSDGSKTYDNISYTQSSDDAMQTTEVERETEKAEIAQSETKEQEEKFEISVPDTEDAFEVESATGSSSGWVWPTYVHTLKSDWPNYSSGKYHGGTDFPVPLNTPVYSSCDGEVVSVKYLTTSYGKHIKIKATVNGSTVYMRYCHLNSILVNQGDHVKAGQEIGKSGSTGNSTGPHLHYEVRNSADRYNPSLNPRLYLPGTSYSFETWGSQDACNCSDSYAGNYIVTTSQYPLTIRSGHGTSFSKVGQIPSGETVYVSKADGSWAHVEYNGVSGLCSMEYLSKKADINIMITGWFSTTAMGDSINQCNSGDSLYLCYRLYDSNTGKNWNELENRSYSVKETVYNPDGSERFNYTYNNSDTNWIKVVPDGEGNYRGKIELTGDRTGHVECSVSVIKHKDLNIMLSSWFSTTAMGDKISSCNTGDNLYLCYRLYDKESGKNWNELESGTYSVKETIYNPDGSEKYSYTYKSSDANWIKIVPDKGGVYKSKIEITGDRIGTSERSVSVTERKDRFGGWLTSDASGKNKITSVKKGQQVYFWYKVYDGNSGLLLNQYRNWNYTLKQTVYKPNGSKLLERTYNNSDNGVLTFTPDTAGKYKCETIITLANNNPATNTISLQVENSELTAQITTSPTGSAISGSQVKLTASANGGSGKYTYKFLICDAKGNWYKLRDYESSNTTIWTPGASGKKTLYVDVKDSEGAVKRTSTSFEVKNKELIVSLTVLPTESAISGSQVKLTASANGGSGSYTYKFLICSDTGNWYKLRDYGNSNAVMWTPGASGKKNLYVDVKDSEGRVKRAGVTFEVKNRAIALASSLSASPTGSAVSGSQVKLTAGANGGTGNYKYKFLICDSKGNWYKLRDYGSSNTAIWIPGAPGKKTIYVDVKDGSGTVKRAGLNYEVKDKNLTVEFTSAPWSKKVISSEKVKLAVNASGGSGNYKYKFLISDQEGNWYLLQDFSKESSIIWIPGKTGDKKLYVYVQDSAGRVARQEFTVTVITMVADVDIDENEIILVGATSDDASDDASDERFSTGTSDTNAEDTLNEVFSAE